MSDEDLRFRDFETFDRQTFLRDLKIIGTMRQFIWFQTAETRGIEEFSLAACEQTWIAIDASDQSATISGHSESRIGPEFGSRTVRGYFVRALEADDFLRVAVG